MTDLRVSDLRVSDLYASDHQASDLRTSLHGLWLPLVTPFRNGELDETSLRRLARHYAALPVNGLILAATTGESLTLTPEETERLVFAVGDEIGGARNLPICLGLSGSNTRALLDTLDRTAAWPIDGYLISCPYYSRPSQQGLQRHFSALADRARHPVMLYNIPYRTGVNLGNEATLRLARHPNIFGLKDCCADRNQSLDLLRRRPQNFAVLTGEDLRAGTGRCRVIHAVRCSAYEGRDISRITGEEAVSLGEIMVGADAVANLDDLGRIMPMAVLDRVTDGFLKSQPCSENVFGRITQVRQNHAHRIDDRSHLVE